MKICNRLLIALLAFTGIANTTNPINFIDAVKKIRQRQEEKKQEELKNVTLKNSTGVTPHQKRMLDITITRKNNQRNQEAISLVEKNIIKKEEIIAVINVSKLDAENKETKITQTPNRQITQLPCLLQTYPALLKLNKLGYHDSQSELYARHNAILFDENTTRSGPLKGRIKELINRLNERNNFEETTLIPCMDKITQKYGRYAQLPPEKLSALIPSYGDKQIVVCLKNNPATSFDFYDHNDEIKILMFKNGSKNKLTWILQPENDKYWFVAHITRNREGKLEAIVADSNGNNRSNDAHVLYLMEFLKSPY